MGINYLGFSENHIFKGTRIHAQGLYLYQSDENQTIKLAPLF